MSDITKPILVVKDPQSLMLSIDKGALFAMKEQLSLLKEFITSQLAKDVDYGRYGNAKKDTLLKSGAEKLQRLFNLGNRVVNVDKIVDKDYVSYAYTVEVYSLKSGLVISQCVGIANSAEKDQWNSNPRRFENTISKIAQKRAMVGAVISATNASDFFTQDMEDNDTIDVNPQITEGEYKIPFGKFQGKRLDEIPREILAQYVLWLQEEARKKGEILKSIQGKFVTHALEFLGENIK